MVRRRQIRFPDTLDSGYSRTHVRVPAVHGRLKTGFADTGQREPARQLALGDTAVAVPVAVWRRIGKDNGEDEDEPAKPKPVLPNIYLDLRTIYTTLPAGALSIGFSAPPLLATLSSLTSLGTLSSPASRSIKHRHSR